MAEPAGTAAKRGATWRGILLLGLVFVLGMVCGAALFFIGGAGDGEAPLPWTARPASDQRADP